MPFEKNHKLGAHKKILKEDPRHSRWFCFARHNATQRRCFSTDLRDTRDKKPNFLPSPTGKKGLQNLWMS